MGCSISPKRQIWPQQSRQEASRTRNPPELQRDPPKVLCPHDQVQRESQAAVSALQARTVRL